MIHTRGGEACVRFQQSVQNVGMIVLRDPRSQLYMGHDYRPIGIIIVIIVGR